MANMLLDMKEGKKKLNEMGSVIDGVLDVGDLSAFYMLDSVYIMIEKKIFKVPIVRGP